jgi:hypothetical protein
MTLLVQYETAGTISGMIPGSLPAATRAAVHVKENQIGLPYKHPFSSSFT